MIKLVQCVRKQPHLTVDQLPGWEVYAERLRTAAIELGAVRVTWSTTLETPLNDALAESRGSAVPFDGVAEIAWLRGAEILARRVAPGDLGAHRRRLRAFQETFADVGRSAFFFYEEELLGERGELVVPVSR